MRIASAALCLVALLWLISSHSAGNCSTPECPAVSVDVVVHHDQVIREQDLGPFFSFNLNHYRFEHDLLKADNSVADKPVENLARLRGNFLRYPGGLVANNFAWEATLGPVAERAPQMSAKHAKSAPVRFGVDEYIELIERTGSKPWYVLNLSGWDALQIGVELPSDEIAATNGRLAAYLRDAFPGDGPRYYQLGNELDRATYQWSAEKYVQRARDSMQAILQADPNARFVAFLRDFDWTYKGKHPDKGSKSTFEDLMRVVLEGLPEINDYSLHFYYDDPGMNRRHKRVGTRLQQMQRAMDYARSVRGGALNVWITEHARGINLGQGGGMKRADVTSNLSAAVSTADFLLGIAQMPEIKGAFWHGVNAGPWQLFDATIKHKDLRPRPVYWGYRVLQSVLLEQTLRTETGPQRGAQYADGYDIRASAFRAADGRSLGVWAANRRDEMVAINLRYEPFAGKTVRLAQYEMYSRPDMDAEDIDNDPVITLSPDSTEVVFDAAGIANLRLMPSSVSALKLSID